MTTSPDGRSPAIACIRVSTELQADRWGPERQRQDIQQAAEREGLRIIDTIEEAISGADHDRAAENAYYQAARAQPGMNFMFSHPNRVGRHVEVTVGIARTIHKLGGTVWIAGLGNLRDARNWRYFLRDAADAEVDHANIVYQLVSGKRSKAHSGRWPHGAPPWGYVLQRDHRGRSTLPAPDPAIAPAIRRLAELSEDHGSTRVAALMQAEGWPTPAGGPWTPTTVKNLLKNERYSGRAVFQGITLNFEPIIPRDQWERLQGKRALRKFESGPRSTELLWAGHVRCAECGGALGRDATRTPYGRYIYYRCWRSKRSEALRLGQTPCTHTRNHRPDQVEEEWWAYLVAALTSPERLPDVIPKPVSPTLAPPPARVAELEANIARAWEPFAAGKISQSIAERLAAPYVQELERLQAEYAPKPIPIGPDYDLMAEQFRAHLHGVTDPAARRELLGILEVRLHVGPEGPTHLTVTPLNG